MLVARLSLFSPFSLLPGMFGMPLGELDSCVPLSERSGGIAAIGGNGEAADSRVDEK